MNKENKFWITWEKNRLMTRRLSKIHAKRHITNTQSIINQINKIKNNGRSTSNGDVT